MKKHKLKANLQRIAALALVLVFLLCGNPRQSHALLVPASYYDMCFNTIKEAVNETGGYNRSIETQEDLNAVYDQALADMVALYNTTTFSDSQAIVVRVPLTKIESSSAGSSRIYSEYVYGSGVPLDFSYNPIMDKPIVVDYANSIVLEYEVFQWGIDTTCQAYDAYYEYTLPEGGQVKYLDTAMAYSNLKYQHYSNGDFLYEQYNTRSLPDGMNQQTRFRYNLGGLFADRYNAKAKGQTISIPLHLKHPIRSDNYKIQRNKVTIPKYVEILYIPNSTDETKKIDNIIQDDSTRPGGHEINYIYNIDGDYIATGGTKIIDEAARIVSNPITGETHNIQSWEYDYSTYTYDVVVDDSTSIKIEYDVGGVNVIYNYTYDGVFPGGASSTIYNYYYADPETPPGVVPGYGTPSPTPAPTNDPGNPGTTNNPGGNNGGNDDDDGFSIWDIIASAIGKIIEVIGTILSSILSALLEVILSLLDLVLKGITGFVELIGKLLLEIPKLFMGFIEFLNAVFPFLPPEIFTVITFGVVVMVLGAILRMIFK